MQNPVFEASGNFSNDKKSGTTTASEPGINLLIDEQSKYPLVTKIIPKFIEYL